MDFPSHDKTEQMPWCEEKDLRDNPRSQSDGVVYESSSCHQVSVRVSDVENQRAGSDTSTSEIFGISKSPF